MALSKYLKTNQLELMNMQARSARPQCKLLASELPFTVCLDALLYLHFIQVTECNCIMFCNKKTLLNYSMLPQTSYALVTCIGCKYASLTQCNLKTWKLSPSLVNT